MPQSVVQKALPKIVFESLTLVYNKYVSTHDLFDLFFNISEQT